MRFSSYRTALGTAIWSLYNQLLCFFFLHSRDFLCAWVAHLLSLFYGAVLMRLKHCAWCPVVTWLICCVVNPTIITFSPISRWCIWSVYLHSFYLHNRIYGSFQRSRYWSKRDKPGVAGFCRLHQRYQRQYTSVAQAWIHQLQATNFSLMPKMCRLHTNISASDSELSKHACWTGARK